MDQIALTAVTRKTADILGTLAVEECTRFYWMEEDIDWIQTEKRRIQAFLRDFDVKLKQDVNERMAGLIVNMRDLAYDAEDIINTFLPKIATHERRKGLFRNLECLCCIFGDWRIRHRFVMETEAIKRRVADINRVRLAYGITENGRSHEVGVEDLDKRQSFSHNEEPIIVGLEEHVEKLENLLKPKEKYRVIPIIGLPGVGKTTLARKVFNSAKSEFGCHAWVYASQRPRVGDLLRDIARQVGVEKEKWDKDADMEGNLYKFLGEKRHLIVIDDIWSTEIWDALKVGIPGNSKNGSALIISSRYKDVGIYADVDNSLLELQPLDDATSWKLFSQIVKLPTQCPEESSESPVLLKLGSEIVKRCEGLPLRIVAMGGLLSRKERTEYNWNSVLKKMGQREDETLTLCLSYEDLPSYLRPCFLYFGLFPEDYEIPASVIIVLWIAEGYIEPRENHTLEDVGDDYLNELIGRNLVQIAKKRFDGRIRSCRIHDVIHALCVSIAKKDILFNTCHGDYSTLATSIRGVAIHQSSICEYISKHQSPKLRALLYFSNNTETLRRKHLVYLHKEFKFMRVLCLEGLVFPQCFPNNLCNLILLKYLRLRGSNLRNIPSSITNLKNLQTLDVQDCEKLNLPTVIWKMQSLRHVLLSPTTSFRRPSISRCTRQCSQVIAEVCLPDLQSLCSLNGKFLKAKCLSEFTNLRKLEIYCCIKQFSEVLTDKLLIPKKLEKLKLIMREDAIPIDIPKGSSSNNLGDRDIPKIEGPLLQFSGYENLHNLYLEGPLVQLPKFTSSLTKLTLVQSKLQQDPMEEIGKLPNLKKLQLLQSCYMGSEMVVAGARAFHQLQVLIVKDMPSLKALKIKESTMSNFKCAKVEGRVALEIDSDKLRNMFSGYLIPTSTVTDKGKEVISEEKMEPEIIETQGDIPGHQFEVGESSSSAAPNMGSN